MNCDGNKCRSIKCTPCGVVWSIIGAVVGIILLCTLIPISFHYVAYNEYAFKQDRYGNVDTSVVLHPGRYFFTLNYNIVRLPSTYQDITVSTPAFTNTGLQFTINVKMLYRLPSTTVGQIYHQYSAGYNTIINNIAKTVIKNTAIQFDVNDLVQDRVTVETILANAVFTVLNKSIPVELPLRYFRLMNIVLTETVLQSSLQSAIELQNNQIRALEQTVAIITADTDTQVATINAHATFVRSSATNQAIQIVADSNSEATRIVLSARGHGLNATLTQLNISEPSARSECIRLFSVMDSNDAKILSGLSGTSLVSV